MAEQIGGLEFTQPLTEQQREVFTPQACQLVANLAREFAPPLRDLLAAREEQQRRYDGGELPDFDPATADIRAGDWRVSPPPPDLQDRRLEITGPVDRKMVINALNADVKVFMADFEDSLSPTWANVAEGQVNLRDAATGEMTHTAPDTGKHYQLGPSPAVLICRVRGLHLPEAHVLLDGQPIPGCLLDFGVYLANNAATLLARGTGPYYYIPKLQTHGEAAWWNGVIEAGQRELGLATGTVRVTCLIETLPAVFQMDEILHALRDHIVALNCGRWDYIFSYIKTLQGHGDRVLPDRQQCTMDKPFLSAYSRLLIRTCHRRGALAMGGMSAFIPLRDPEANAQVLDKVRADKQLEAGNGHDGTWIAHPGLAEVVSQVFDAQLGAAPNQLQVTRDNDGPITARELLAVPDGSCTEEGMRSNIRVSVQYLEAWISGNGCVPIYGLMEDAATAEISRSSIWQWIRHGVVLDNGKQVTEALFREVLAQEMDTLKAELGEGRFAQGRFAEAAELFVDLALAQRMEDFLTLPGYRKL